jgi:hypothetical protein
MTDTYDVFISYARLDSTRAEQIRHLLEAHGLKVFFDTEGIDTGEEFPVVIDRAVKGAKCVLGLWSSEAFTGRWVRIESRIGLDQRKLVAAVLDETRPEDLPAEFYNVNVENLSSFDGDPKHDGWQRVLRAIGRRVGRDDLSSAPSSPRPQPPRAAPPPPPQFQSQSHAQSQAQSHAPAKGANLGFIIGGIALIAVLGYIAYDQFGSNSGPPAPAQIEAEQKAEEPAVNAEDSEAREREAAAQRAADAETARARLEEMRVWGACEGGALAACRRYLEAFPSGEFARAATAKVEELTRPVAADLSGNWSGYYAQGNNRTPFALEASGRSGAFRGRTTEPNTFGDRSATQLFGNVSGRTLDDGTVTFTKTYDGTGGVSHAVEYAGRIDETGRIITGRWRIGAQGDVFRLERR